MRTAPITPCSVCSKLFRSPGSTGGSAGAAFWDCSRIPFQRTAWHDPDQSIVAAEEDGIICGYAVLNHIQKPANPYRMKIALDKQHGILYDTLGVNDKHKLFYEI